MSHEEGVPLGTMHDTARAILARLFWGVNPSSCALRVQILVSGTPPKHPVVLAELHRSGEPCEAIRRELFAAEIPPLPEDGAFWEKAREAAERFGLGEPEREMPLGSTLIRRYLPALALAAALEDASQEAPRVLRLAAAFWRGCAAPDDLLLSWGRDAKRHLPAARSTVEGT